MDRIESKKELLYSDISEAIIGCCFEIMRELGAGFLENVYKNALLKLCLETARSGNM
jgi:GxxExxY protein